MKTQNPIDNIDAGPSQNNPSQPKGEYEKDRHAALKSICVWLFRALFGGAFILSGWAKAIDPWGFYYKIGEYFAAWDMSFGDELTLILAIGLSAFEFTLGVCVLTGSLRHSSAWCSLLTMAAMLPFTIYIAVADPVSDCGCFGDFIVISNSATMWKNVILAILAVLLVKYNGCRKGIIAPSLQWIMIAASVGFVLALCWIGHQIQPAIDFRLYPEGSVLVPDEDEDAEVLLVYEKNGREKMFDLDMLPDSTWTFVRQEYAGEDGDNAISVFDGEDEVAGDVFSDEGKMLILTVPTLDNDYLYQSRLSNRLSNYIESKQGRMVALVAADGQRLSDWKSLALPKFEVYTAEDTALKELVRGEPGLLYLEDGKIIWKRTLSSVNPDDYDIDLDDTDVDYLTMIAGDGPEGKYKTSLIAYLTVLSALIFFSLPSRIYNHLKNKNKIKTHKDNQ